MKVIVMLQMEMTFDIIGDSHLARLEAARTYIPIEGKVELWARRGGGIAHLEKVIDDIEWDMLGRYPRVGSDITIVFLGGNDIDKPFFNPKRLANRYARAVEQLVRMDSMVIIMAQWPRPGARVGGVHFRTDTLLFEKYLCDQLPASAWLWEWDSQMRFNDYFFQRDGVHCVPLRMVKLSRYLSAAAIAAARLFRRIHCY
jgi:hypothetical protein